MSHHKKAPSLLIGKMPKENAMTYNRHGQRAALQLIFAALGPFSGMRKSNLDLLLPEIWPKTVNKSIYRTNFFSTG